MEEIAAVYARSLFEVARDEGTLDDVREQLGQIADALGEQQELQVFFFSPYFSTQEKAEGLERMIEGADPMVMNFLRVLMEKHRMPAIFRIRRAFDEMWEDENRLLPVQITSAIELDEAVAKQIGDKIAEQTDRRVELSTSVDPEVLGGLVVQVGNTVLDASVRHRLEQLRKEVVRVS